MNKMLKPFSIAIATILMSQSIIFIPPAQANSTPIISRTEYSETTRNMDLTYRTEVFPSPIYIKDPSTGDLNPNWVEGSDYSLYQTSISDAEETSIAWQRLTAGRTATDQHIALLKFGNKLPDLDGGLVFNAEIELFEQDKPVKWGYGDPVIIDESYSIHKLMSDWTGGSVSWKTQPLLSEPYATKTKYIGKDGGHFKWDITKMVAEWVHNPSSDFGLAVQGTNNGTDNFRAFYTSKGYANKSYSQMDKAPRLIINYSPRPTIGSGLGHGLELNSGQAYVDLSWPIQKGVKGYKLAIFNGKSYEQIDVGLTNNWTSRNKNLWPTAEAIENGEFNLKLDGTGTELSSNPGLVYKNVGNSEADPTHYYFKLIAYNDVAESGASEVQSVAVPNRTAPDKLENLRVTEASPEGVHIKWNPLQGAKEYRVTTGSKPESNDIAAGVKTINNEIFIASDKFTQRQTIYISVEAVDQEGNYSGYTTPIPVVIKAKHDAEIISMPFSSSVENVEAMSVTVKNMGSEAWTAEKGHELKLMSGNVLLAAEPLAPGEVIAPDGTKVFNIQFTGKRPLGEIPVEWQMQQRNRGVFGNALTRTVSFYDSKKPDVSFQMANASASLYKVVEINGTVKDATLNEYVLTYASDNAPSNWITIASGVEPVENERIANWDTTGLASGTYTLKLEAQDEAGNVNTAIQKVNVNMPISEPIVADVTDQTTVITGGPLETGLTVFAQKGSEILGSDLVDSAGSFSIPISKQQAGTTLSLYAKNEFGISSRVVSVTVKDVTPPPLPKVYALADNSLKLNGSAEKGSTIIVTKGTAVIGTGTASATGYFSIPIAKQTAGTKLQVKAKDAAENLSAATSVTVIDKTPPPAPTIFTIADYSTSVKGIAEKNAVVTIIKDNKVIGTGKATQYGGYTIAIPKQKAGSILYVTAKDSIGNTSSSAKKTVIDKTAPTIPTVKTVYSYSKAISGKTEPYATVSVKKGSYTIGSAKATSTGSYSVKIKPQAKRVGLTITAADKSGNRSRALSIKVK